jgi:AAA15 family ATPase/GTPase
VAPIYNALIKVALTTPHLLIHKELSHTYISKDIIKHVSENWIGNNGAWNNMRNSFSYTSNNYDLVVASLDRKLSGFDDVLKSYLDIFPEVEDIIIKNIPEKESENSFGFGMWLKIRNKSELVPQTDISSGMYKTLLLISQIILSKGKKLLLHDEIENSLGINCLNEVSELYVDSISQVILTSHHPYIINTIPMKSWKVVVRDGNKILCKSPEELGLCRSKHEAFMQLINNNAFKTGKIK